MRISKDGCQIGLPQSTTGPIRMPPVLFLEIAYNASYTLWAKMLTRRHFKPKAAAAAHSTGVLNVGRQEV